MLFAYQKELKGQKIGVVFGSFAPLHQGHLDLIMRAKKENDGGCIVIVCGYDGDKGEPLMPHELRYRYVREFFADDDLVSVYAINDTELGIARYPNGWEKWLAEFDKIWCKAVARGIAEPRRVWYVGEQDYYDGLCLRYETAVLVNRLKNPISASMIREKPLKYWDKIAHPFRRLFSKNILIIGTASEGKTIMTADLGKYFNAPYSWEWARVIGDCSIMRPFNTCDECRAATGKYCGHIKLATKLYNAGYRRQGEVIDEFAERLKPRVDCEYGNKFYRDKCFEEIDNLVEEMKGGAE